MGTRAGGLRALLIYHQEHLVLYRKAFYVPFPVDLLSTRPIKACPDNCHSPSEKTAPTLRKHTKNCYIEEH
jgi:hypothetical protein